jgi:hypothetical protein
VRRVTRISTPAPWPGHAGRRLSAWTSRRMVEQSEKVSAMRAAPNTSLQRTPAAALPSPLSSQALGGTKS